MIHNTVIRWSAPLIVLAAIVGLTALAQASALRFKNPVPFYGAQLVGFDKTGLIKGNSKAWVPSTREAMFVSIKLEMARPFEYYKGRFREIILQDESGKQYQYKGLLDPEKGWMQIDDAESVGADKPMLTFSADNYPWHIDIHFEVPIGSHKITLKFKEHERVLFESVE